MLGEFWRSDPAVDVQVHTAQWVPEDRQLNLADYVDAVLEAKDRGLPVLLGLELDFFPDTIEAVLELLEPYPWDVLIGSIDWIGAWSVDHRGAVEEFDRRGVETAYDQYFELETLLAASGSVDVLTHVDVVKKLGHRHPSPPTELYESVVSAAVSSGTAVEVSTAGLDQPIGELYPAPDFLQMFYDAGVPITLASDAHHPEHCARDFDVAVAAARRAGYRQRLQFHERVGELVPLPDL